MTNTKTEGALTVKKDKASEKDIMDSQDKKDFLKGEDGDSGLDNTSDSGHSGDEDFLTISSDSDDLLNCDDKVDSRENDEKGERVRFSPDSEQTLHSDTNPGKSGTLMMTLSDGSKSDVRIDLNYDIGSVDEEYLEVIEFYKALARSQSETVDFSVTSSAKRPEWLNEEKFKRGQKFARDHLFCINFAEMLSLFILFAQKSSLGPLIFTGKSDSPYTAFHRYLNTLTKLMSWYQDDVWNKDDCAGKKNLSIVRGMHKNVYEKLTNTDSKTLAEKTTLGDPTTTALWCPFRDLLLEDFRESVSTPIVNLDQFTPSKKVWVNQADMSMTQFGFVGLAVTYPKHFGIHLASDEDLDAFLHLWRGLGYLLGIKDEYNYCNADLETVRRRTKFYLEVIAKPAFREVTCDWEHMCRCLTAGISYYLPQVNFGSSLLYLCHILEIKTPRLRKAISFGAYIIFQVHKLIFYLMKFPGVLSWLNSRLHELIKKTQNASPEVLNEWENKEFSYTKQPGKCPIRH